MTKDRLKEANKLDRNIKFLKENIILIQRLLDEEGLFDKDEMNANIEISYISESIAVRYELMTALLENVLEQDKQKLFVLETKFIEL